LRINGEIDVVEVDTVDQAIRLLLMAK
jgi:hypothetical protein